jgi:hypothetical protein
LHLARAVRGGEASGKTVTRAEVDKDGRIVVVFGTPEPAEEKDKGPPNSFDQVLGDAA